MENKTMTKSTITREESIQAVFDLKVGYTLCLADIEILKRVARIALAAMDSEPVSQNEPISFDEWSRKCALQITLCYPDFREKAQYIWDSARETQRVAPVVPDEVTAEDCPAFVEYEVAEVDEAWSRGFNDCRS
ncbi:hypothetical protein H5833_29340, partial [Klebsiella pneumoniae]|nr:hypothetical protein [Klebsiella pneumoniae]